MLTLLHFLQSQRSGLNRRPRHSLYRHLPQFPAFWPSPKAKYSPDRPKKGENCATTGNETVTELLPGQATLPAGQERSSSSGSNRPSGQAQVGGNCAGAMVATAVVSARGDDGPKGYPVRRSRPPAGPVTALSSELHPSFVAARVGLAYCWANLIVLAIALLFVLLGGAQ